MVCTPKVGEYGAAKSTTEKNQGEGRLDGREVKEEEKDYSKVWIKK